MAIYKQTITGSLNTNTAEAMSSWLSNCINFINTSTGLTLTYTQVSSSAGSTGFFVEVPISGSYLTKFGIIMSTTSSTSNYFSNIIHNNTIFPLNEYGNVFDYSNYYRTDVVIFHTADTLHVLCAFDGEYHTMIQMNRFTEITTGTKYWGCSGFVATSPTSYILEDLTPARNDSTSGGALEDDISITNAVTEYGRFSADNLYSYYVSSATVLPEFLPFTLTFEDETERNALILGSSIVNGSGNVEYGGGKYISFSA